MDSKIIIAGPCAAESEEQVLITAQQIAEVCGGGQHVLFRAGVWKPRTSPDTFRGVGEPALNWLQRVRRELGMEVATEVATREHVRLALAAGIDYLWLGARTTANPIQVQEIADAVHEAVADGLPCPKAVLVKNPVNEDTLLWTGDIARIEQTGIRAMAIHRGCAHHPCWAMAHSLRRLRPDIPLLIDPSHMSGDAQKVAELVQAADRLCYDGMMVETHVRPEQALSDAKQQITPAALGQIISASRHADAAPTADTELQWYRAEIDEIDDRLWTILVQRMEVSEQIGAWKKAHGVQPLQPDRFAEILQRRLRWAQAEGLPIEMVEHIFREIHAESIRRQQ
ncbi:MAG: chorismate mutase [Paludibacteraceae bacterium]